MLDHVERETECEREREIEENSAHERDFKNTEDIATSFTALLVIVIIAALVLAAGTRWLFLVEQLALVFV